MDFVQLLLLKGETKAVIMHWMYEQNIGKYSNHYQRSSPKKTTPEKEFCQHIQRQRQARLHMFQLRNMSGYSINKTDD
jgi:hypothetical protein